MIETYNGDMLTELVNIDDTSIDLLLTDPPYNISERGAKPEWDKIDEVTGEVINLNGIHSQKFDETFAENWDSIDNSDFKQQMRGWAKAWFPKLRKGGTFAIFISDVYISHLWEAMEEVGFEPKRVFTWKKPAAVPFNRKVNPVSGCEYVLWGIKPGGKRTFNSDAVEGTMIERYSLADKVSSILYKIIKDNPEKDLASCFRIAEKEAVKKQSALKRTDNTIHCVIPNTISYSGGTGKKVHPTQKPEEVLKYFIELCSKPGDTVLDTFAGSGSTGKAALSSNRNVILIERDEKMYDIMNSRFSSLFGF
jgi:site-specific DNA-methyltransferase (adenine-specific)/modification methylase|tara:strand:+ start:168 stop:1091 length:924 start_codon:yes stop_codon:yes gene_type:complete